MGTNSVELFTPSDMLDHISTPTENQVGAVLDGVDELAAYTGRRPLQCFTIKMPLPMYFELKRLNKQMRDAAPEEDKVNYTMTAWVNSAVSKVVLPAIKEGLARVKAQASGNTPATAEPQAS
jgi:hypothetical protein